MELRFPRIRWTVRRKLALSSAAVLLSLSLFAYLSMRASIDDLRRQVLNRSLSASTLVEMTTREYLDEVERHLASFAEISALRQRDDVLGDEIMRELSFRYPRYANLFAAHSDGTVFARAVWESRLPDNLSSERFFLDAVRTGELAVSERLFSTGSVGPTVHVAVPLKDYAGRVTGVLGGTLSLAELQYQVMQIWTAESACVIVTDRNGTVLLHPLLDQVIAGRSLDGLAFVRDALRGDRGYVDGDLLGTGENWLGVYRPIPRASWALVVAYPESSTGQLVREAVLRNGIYLVMAVLLVLPALLFVFRRIGRELNRLSSEARALAQPDAHVDEGGYGDELSQLRHSFASISHQLASTRWEVAKKGQDLQKVLARFDRIREEERKQLALEVHDGVAQFIVCALQQARETERCLSASSSEAAARLRTALDLLDQAVAAMDSVIFSLRPVDIPEGELLTAVQRLLVNLEATQGTRCTLSVSGNARKLARETNLVAYRVVQEALSNVLKHSGAANVQVTFRYGAEELAITVDDDGRGFDPGASLAERTTCLGIAGMKERAAGIGGECRVVSSSGKGTSVFLRLPTAPRRRRGKGAAVGSAADHHGRPAGIAR